VSKLWDHIRTHGLQDPADKRTIIADAKLRPIFGKDRLTMFELSKVIGPHLTAA
jgi:DNA topoisomerase-3